MHVRVYVCVCVRACACVRVCVLCVCVCKKIPRMTNPLKQVEIMITSAKLTAFNK